MKVQDSGLNNKNVALENPPLQILWGRQGILRNSKVGSDLGTDFYDPYY